MDEINEQQDAQELVATETEVEEAIEDSDDPAVLKARIKKLEEKAIAARERTRLIRQEKAKLEAKNEKIPGELDTAEYAYLAAKGIEDDEDIEYINNRMKKWDMSLRDVLKDEDVQAKLKGMKIEREVKAATPGSTRRSSQGTIDNVDYWIAKYEMTGELPSDFALRSAVINAKVDKESTNKPSWR